MAPLILQMASERCASLQEFLKRLAKISCRGMSFSHNTNQHDHNQQQQQQQQKQYKRPRDECNRDPHGPRPALDLHNVDVRDAGHPHAPQPADPPLAIAASSPNLDPIMAVEGDILDGALDESSCTSSYPVSLLQPTVLNSSPASCLSATSTTESSSSPATLPPLASWTMAADSVAISEAARCFGLVAARNMFHTDVNVIFHHHPMSVSSSGTLFASLLSVFTAIKRGAIVEGFWWTPLIHSCTLNSGSLVFADSVMKTFHALVLDRLTLHFEVNDVWKAKQSAQHCVYVKRGLHILQQLRIVDKISNFANLKHTDANDWEEVQLQVKHQAAVGLSMMTSSVISCFHRSLVGQTPSSTVGSRCIAEHRDGGIWSICIEGCSAPVVEIHDSRLQRMWAAFCTSSTSPPLNFNFFEALYACLLRYESTMHCVSGRFSHHFGIPSGHLPSISRAVAANRDGSRSICDWIDCFSTPMTLLQLASDDLGSSRSHMFGPSNSFVRYCSPYVDTDSCFGSLGSFFDADFQTIAAKGDVLFLHPPNDSLVLERVSNVLKEMFVDRPNDFAGICVFPSTKSALKTQEVFRSVSFWQSVAIPVFCSGHSRDNVAVTRLNDCEYRVGSISRVGDLQVVLKPLLLSLVASFNSALASLVPPQITHKNGSHYLTKLECDKGQAMLQSAVRDSAIQLKYASIARGYVEQVHGTFCCPASIITIVNAARPGVEKLLVKDFFTQEIEAILPHDVIACNGVTLECLPMLMNAHGLVDCSITLASSCALASLRHVVDAHAQWCPGTSSEFRDAAISSLKQHSSFIIVNFSRRSLNQKGWGHFSPLAAYDAATDAFLVMDVEAASGFHSKFWVTCEALHAAMVGTILDGSGRSRGWVKASIASRF